MAKAMSNLRLGTQCVLVATLVLGSILGCREDKPQKQAATRATPRDSTAPTTPRDTAARDTVESAGEVASYSIATPIVAERWITDANVVSLLNIMNGRQVAAADIELSTWHSDTIRAFAASMAREHAELQHGIDSIALRLNLTPVSPALARSWTTTMQAQIDTMRQSRGDALDRAYVHHQVVSHQLMGENIKQLAGAAERPELRSFLEGVAVRVASQLQRARSLQTTLAAVDSAAEARSAATRKRTSTP